MTEEERALLELLIAERDAARLVSELVAQGFTVDEALGLVQFPDQ